VKALLRGRGVTEVRTHSLTNAGKQFGSFSAWNSDLIELTNPLSLEFSHYRRSLIPGLLEILRENTGYGTQDVQIFEAGHVGIPADGAPREKVSTAALLTGPLYESKWDGEQESVGFFYAKGILGDMLRSVGLPDLELRAADGDIYQPGRRATVFVNGAEIGAIGELHEDLAKELRAKDPVVVFEVDFDAVVEMAPRGRAITAPSKFPPVSRDLSVVVDGDVCHRDVESLIRAVAGDLVEVVSLFDVYRGKQIGPGKKSMAYAVRFRSLTETLTDARIDEIMDEIRRRLVATYQAAFRE
jgi:phenylalanyl-tRNA synthetase beta chain